MSHTGSEWSRWDLHVHTPSSHTQHFGGESDEIWERYIQDLEALPANVTVLGINDYLTVDGYERLRHAKDEEQRLPNIKLLLPVIELRLKMFGGQEKWVRVNYHVIFSDEVTPASIRSQFLAKLNASYEMKGHKWSGAPLPDQMERFAEVIRASATNPHSGDDFALAAAYYNVDIEQVRKVLSESSDFHGRFVEALGKPEWEALRWEGSTAEKLTLIERSDFLFTACETEGEFHRSQRKLQNGTATAGYSIARTLITCRTAPSRTGLATA